MPNPTMRAIAEACGVSRQTVGLALGDRSHLLLPETVARVVATAKRMGYRPHQGALALKRGAFGAVALLHDVHAHLPRNLLGGLAASCRMRDLHIVLADAEEWTRTGRTDAPPKLLRQLLVDGVIANLDAPPDADLKKALRSTGVPIRWLNQEAGEGSLRPDDEDAAGMAVAALVQRGHRRIAFTGLLGGGNPHHSWAARSSGYRRGMAAAGLPVRVEHAVQIPDGAERIRAATALLASPDRPDAVLAYSERALSAFTLAACHLGLAIPGDLSLAAFLDGEAGQDLGLRFGGMTIPWQALAEATIASLESGDERSRAIPFGPFADGTTVGRRG